MLKAKVTRENLDYEADGSSVTILTDLAALVVAVVDEVCTEAKLDKNDTLDAFFRAVKKSVMEDTEQ